MRIVIEERTPTLAQNPNIPDIAPWMEEGAYGSIQLARQAFLVLRMQLTEGQTLRIRLEDHDGQIPDGWRRGSKILDEHTIKDGKGVKGKRISTLLTRKPEFEPLINAKLRIGPSRPQVVKQ